MNIKSNDINKILLYKYYYLRDFSEKLWDEYDFSFSTSICMDCVATGTFYKWLRLGTHSE